MVFDLCVTVLGAPTVVRVHREFPDLDAVLRGALAWPVANVACAAIDRSGDEHVVGDATRVFALASVTKLATALAVLIACEEGVVALDDPAPGVDDATVRDLLCHAAGLPFEGDGPRRAPRQLRTYSNEGYRLLGDLVAGRAGFAFADYLREAVLEPLGMHDAALDGHPGSGLHASLHDVVALVRELQRPTLLAPETWQDMTSVQYPELAGVLPGYGRQDPNPWGLGPEIRGTKSPHWSAPWGSPRTFGHFGRSGTLVWVDPDAGVGFAALTDREFGAWAVDAWPRLSGDVLDHA